MSGGAGGAGGDGAGGDGAGGRRGAILSVGRVYCDLVFTGLPAMPQPGREVFAGALTLAAGGGAYITAAYVAALAREARLCAMLPAAPFAALVRAEAEANGVNLAPSTAGEGEGEGEGAPQITVAMVAGGGERAFLTRREGRALPAGWAAAVAAPGLAHLHIGEVTTLLEEPGLIAAARAAGLTISLDCGWDDTAFADPALPGLIAQVDVFLPNAAEAERLAAVAPVPGLAPLVVVKQGAGGAWAVQGGRRTHAAAVAAKVVDTTGAGDAFNAGFVLAWLDGADCAAALAQGVRCGAVAVARPGGAGRLGRGALASAGAGVDAAE